MSKFKIGDMVIPERFKRDDTIFDPRMYDLVGKPGTITCIDDEPDEHHYQINGWWWPEGSLKLAEPQTLVAEPSRKTLGDFMLAALTGIDANPAIINPTTDVGPGEASRMALRQAKAAFELYEKYV